MDRERRAALNRRALSARPVRAAQRRGEFVELDGLCEVSVEAVMRLGELPAIFTFHSQRL